MTQTECDGHDAARDGGSAAVQRAWDWINEMTSLDADVEQDCHRIDLLTVMEAVKAASAAVQARVTADFVASQTAAAEELAEAAMSAAGMVRHELRPETVRRSVCGQVALARRETPDRGPVLVNLAQALTTDLPHTMAALTAGATSEYRAILVHRETACLSPELRREADAALADVLPGLGNRQVGERAREQALRLDPEAAKRRVRAAVGQRRVTLRRAPDAMAYVTALLPAGAATVCLRSLERAADAVIESGADGNGADGAGGAGPLGRSALMAGTFVERLSQGLIAGCDEMGAPTGGPASAAAGDPADAVEQADGADAADSEEETVGSAAADTDADADAESDIVAEPESGFEHGVRCGAESGLSAQEPADESECSLDLLVHLVMTDRALFGVDEEPAQLIGYGPIPAQLARRMVAADLGPRAKMWIRRLFIEPESGRLAAMDSRSRFFPDSLKQFLLARDRQCRMPFCGAPARHADHTVAHAHGGRTSVANGECTSVNCNLLKEANGWSAAPASDGSITVSTPTGHRYRSDEPSPPHSPPWDAPARGHHAGPGSAVADAGARARPDPPPERDAESAEWERILDAALAGAEQPAPASRRSPGSLGGPDLPPAVWRMPRSVTTARRKITREVPGGKRSRRPRPPARHRPRLIDPAIARRRLDLLSQIREGSVIRR